MTDSQIEQLGKEREKALNRQTEVWQKRLDDIRGAPKISTDQKPPDFVTESEVAEEMLAILAGFYEDDSHTSEVD